jgi:GDPmannose 4,6-dehydratase
VGLDWQEYVRVDPALERGAAELRRLVGNPAKVRAKLKWEPEVDFTQLVHLLVDADLKRLRADETATSMERR